MASGWDFCVCPSDSQATLLSVSSDIDLSGYSWPSVCRCFSFSECLSLSLWRPFCQSVPPPHSMSLNQLYIITRLATQPHTRQSNVNTEPYYATQHKPFVSDTTNTSAADSLSKHHLVSLTCPEVFMVVVVVLFITCLALYWQQMLAILYVIFHFAFSTWRNYSRIKTISGSWLMLCFLTIRIYGDRKLNRFIIWILFFT